MPFSCHNVSFITPLSLLLWYNYTLWLNWILETKRLCSSHLWEHQCLIFTSIILFLYFYFHIMMSYLSKLCISFLLSFNDQQSPCNVIKSDCLERASCIVVTFVFCHGKWQESNFCQEMKLLLNILESFFFVLL